MKITCCLLICALPAVFSAFPAGAQDAPAVDRVTVKDNRTVAVRGAEQVQLEKPLSWPNEITVTTNGTYKVGEGRERPIQEGQFLRRDGSVLNPDGSTFPVYDHLAMVRGQTMIMVDGERSVLTTTHELGSGRRVSPDGRLTEPNGVTRFLLDGELIRINGGSVPARDTISLRDGKVSVQKDGSILDVPPGRTITMNDGTKVFGEGYFLRRDGTKVVLAEGQTVEVEGVIRR